MSQSYLRSIYLRLAGVVMLIVMLALAASAFLSHRAFEKALAPEMAKKVASGGASARSLVLKAMENHIAFREIYGIEQTFDDLKRSIPDIAYVAVTDTQGTVLYQRFTAPAGAEAHFRAPGVLAAIATPDVLPASVRVGNQYVVSMPIVTPQQPVGMMHIGVSVDFVDRIVLDMLFDVLVVLVVALFFTLELLNFMAGSKLEASLKSLGDTIERGASGDFTPLRSRGPQGQSGPFAAVLQLLEDVRARVNTGFEMLSRDIDHGRRVPAHERPPGLAAAHHGLQALSQRFRFGSAAPATRGDDGQLAKIRAPLFVFILAEELTRPFLPGYIKSLLVPLPGLSWLSAEVVVGLPIALFMLIVALGQPFLGAYAQRVGHRRAMTVGAGVAAFGFVASALAGSVLDLLLWRSLCALGYGLVFVAAQGHVLEHTHNGNRAKSFAVFIGSIMVATVCGPSIGGILADNIGERWTMGVAAVLAIGSMGAIRLLPRQDAQAAAAQSAVKPPSLRDIGSLMFNKRFMTVTGLAAIPAKVLLTGVCFYLVPLYVLSLGSTQSVVGRILMLYGVVMVVVSPLAASLATTRQRMEWLVGAGLLLSGIGTLLLMAGNEVGWIFAAVFLIGLGQSLSIAAQSALVREHCDQEVSAIGEPAVYGVYRLLERLGNALGPLLAAVLLTAFGYRTSFVATGSAVALCGLLFILATRRKTARFGLATVS
jgi:predicted MFS family arabinose efflux permease